ncbi:Non-specific lipid-transfer protein [Spatholobus suberectus]|nr:Non-specific lipid-transfer protein [Spatholobus suberectus]
MAAKWFLIVCVVAIWAVDPAASSHHGHAHAPAPSVDCKSLVLTLADCLSFVSNGSTVTKPEGSCCSSLKSVLKTAPNCLCLVFNSSAQLGLALNVTKALTLPAACKLSAPSFSNCGLSLTPAAAPGLSPPSATATLSPKGAPSPSSENAASALIPFSAGSLIVCLLVAVFGPGLIPF